MANLTQTLTTLTADGKTPSARGVTTPADDHFYAAEQGFTSAERVKHAAEQGCTSAERQTYTAEALFTSAEGPTHPVDYTNRHLKAFLACLKAKKLELPFGVCTFIMLKLSRIYELH